MHCQAFLLPTPLTKFPPASTVQSLRPLHTHRRRTRSTRRLRSTGRLAPSATTAAATSPQPSEDPAPPVWRSYPNLDVYIPKSPSLIVIFTGGLAASLSPRTTYSSFLTRVIQTTNAAVIAHRTPPSTDHSKLARSIAADVEPHLRSVRKRNPDIPTFAMGHSLGAKLALLTSIDHTCREALGGIQASILISFCNRAAGDAVPWGEAGKQRAADTLGQVSSFLRGMDVSGFGFEDRQAGAVREKITNVMDAVGNSLRSEFKPSADETLALVGSRYNVRRNLVVSFERDELDDADELIRILKSRFGEGGAIVRRLAGTHVTPMTPDVGNDFYKTGSEQVDGWVRNAGGSVGKELDGLVAVVCAFLKLQSEAAK